MAAAIATTLTAFSAAIAAAFWLIVLCASATAAAIAVASTAISAAIAAFWLIVVCPICCLCFRRHV
jgi:hypothetical protein